MDKETLVSDVTKLLEQLGKFNDDDRMDVINCIREALHEYSPMKENPVDCVLWVKQDDVHANAYNPNAVAPPEMTLLQKSIEEDGMTQPVVSWKDENGQIEIVDSFHRYKIAQSKTMHKRLQGRLPITIVNQNKTALADRMASTIRHNRARGEHSTELMQHIVSELVQAGMSDKWIMQHIGMDADELLRLKQLTGLAALFRHGEFSRAWVAEDNTEAWEIVGEE